MKRYTLIVALLILNVAVFGIAAPFLISMASTEMVLLGFLAIAVLLPLDVWLVKLTVKG